MAMTSEVHNVSSLGHIGSGETYSRYESKYARSGEVLFGVQLHHQVVHNASLEGSRVSKSLRTVSRLRTFVELHACLMTCSGCSSILNGSCCINVRLAVRCGDGRMRGTNDVISPTVCSPPRCVPETQRQWTSKRIFPVNG